MRLRTRLFLFVGALILAICLVLYVVPEYIAEVHVKKDRARYLERLKKERMVDHERLSEWLAGEIGGAEGVIDAFLFMVDGHPDLGKALTATDDPVKGRVWLPAAQLLAYSERLDLLQVTHQGSLDAAITLSNAKLYRSRQFPIGEGLSWVILDCGPDSKSSWREAYLGIWFPKGFTKGIELGFEPSLEIPHTLLLFDPVTLFKGKDHFTQLFKEKGEQIGAISLADVPDAGKLALQLLQSLAAAEQFLQKRFGDKSEALDQYLESLGVNGKGLPVLGMAPPVEKTMKPQEMGLFQGEVEGKRAEEVSEAAFAETLTRELKRTNDLELIATLGFLASVDALWTSPFAPAAPVGAARIETGHGVGTAVLSRDVFAQDLLWDAGKHLKTYPPKTKEIPVASEFGFLTGKEVGELTIVNSMELTPALSTAQKLPPSYLTLGASLKPMVSTLAQITGDTNLLVFEGKVLVHIASKEVSLSDEARLELEDKGPTLKEPIGFITLAGENYYYSRYQPKPEWDLYFVTLEPAEQALAPVEAFEARSRDMVRKLTLRIILVALGVFVIALVILEIIARRFTKPISKLAVATEHVSAGHYENIDLPKVKEGSKNEISVLTHSFTKMIQGLKDREKIRGVLDKVVSKEIADEILQGKVTLGGEVREVCVLFADIRNFTQITANLPPEEVITFVNAYMNEMTQIIETYQGVIDKYVGDEVMALFGAPVSHKFAPLQAVLAAITIRDKLTQWNEERKEQGLFICHVGIGVHYGPMVAGNMGAEDRLNYTVLGTNVNLASRLCDLAKEKEILISETMAHRKQIQDTMILAKRDAIQFKGFAEPMPVYSVEGIKPGFLLGKLSQMAREFKAKETETPEVWETD